MANNPNVQLQTTGVYRTLSWKRRSCHIRPRSGTRCRESEPRGSFYGSDGPVCSPRIDVEKVGLAGLSPEAEALVLGRNAQRILESVS